LQSTSSVTVRSYTSPIYGATRRFDGDRLRPDRHGSDEGERGIPGPPKNQGSRGAVPAFRGLRPDREGRGPGLQSDWGDRGLKNPGNRRRAGDEDACSNGVLRPTPPLAPRGAASIQRLRLGRPRALGPPPRGGRWSGPGARTETVRDTPHSSLCSPQDSRDTR